jgi:hypothetical protein
MLKPARIVRTTFQTIRKSKSKLGIESSFSPNANEMATPNMISQRREITNQSAMNGDSDLRTTQ